jgi:hypothetical protein
MSIQFLTDEEYEAINRDVTSIIRFHIDEYAMQAPLDSDVKQAIDKLTAYVDQKIKRYADE